MHIETLGSGPDLVLIHGWALHGGVFAPLARRLAPHFRLHLVDLPGHGLSRDPDETLDLRSVAVHVAAQTPPAIWLGWSLGGLLALRAAAALLPLAYFGFGWTQVFFAHNSGNMFYIFSLVALWGAICRLESGATFAPASACRKPGLPASPVPAHTAHR